MQQDQVIPIHVDSPKSRRNPGLIISMIAAVVGMYLLVESGGGTVQPLLILGVIGASYSWFVTPRQFRIYQNALVIKFGWPKLKVIPLSEITQMEKVEAHTGERLRVRLTNRRQIMVTVDNINEFRTRLDQARLNFDVTDVKSTSTVVEPGQDVYQEPEGPAPY